MLMIRHSIGSRLLCQANIYTIDNQDDRWLISVSIDEETASKVLDFKDELNIFEVKENVKAWFYSSDAQIHFQHNDNQLIIFADHNTVYPT